MGADRLIAAYRRVGTILQGLLPLLALAVLVGAGVVLGAAIASGDAWAAAGAWLAALTLFAALLAFFVALPGFIDWHREQAAEPDIRIWMQSSGNRGHRMEDIPQTPDGSFELDLPVGHYGRFVRVVVVNEGNRALASGTMNLVVLSTCAIEPAETAAYKQHAESGFVNLDNEIIDGEEHEVAWTSARADFAPGHTVHTARVTVPDPGSAWPGEYPLMVKLTGDAGASGRREYSARLTLRTASE